MRANTPPALSDSHVVGVYCRQSRERLRGQMFGRRRRVLSLLLLIYILGAFPKDYLNWFYRDLDYNVLHGLEVCRAALSLQENSKSAIEVYVVIPTQLC